MFGAIGFVDDWIKVRHQRSLGLRKRAKLAAQVVAGVVFSELAVHWAHTSTALSFTRAANPGLAPGRGRVGGARHFVLVATSNAVNLTDGLDGLAAGVADVLLRRPRHHGLLDLPALRDLPRPPGLGPRPRAVLGGARRGVRSAFCGGTPRRRGSSWATPGPSPSVPGLAALCLLLNLDLLLPIMGGLFVIETLSVMAQVVSFRVFGRRVLRMAPIHHHFELLGWPETTVIVRFWMLAGLFAALGLGIFYGEFLVMTKAVA